MTTRKHPSRKRRSESANKADEARAIAVIVSAFATDPAARWMYPDASRYNACFPEFVKAFGGRAFACGTAHVIGDVKGGACGCRRAFIPTTRPSRPDPAHRAPRAGGTVRAVRAVRADGQLSSRRTALAPAASSASILTCQRKGYGAALLRYALQTVSMSRACRPISNRPTPKTSRSISVTDLRCSAARSRSARRRRSRRCCASRADGYPLL